MDQNKLAGVVGFEPTKCRSQSPVPYRLATPHRNSVSAAVAAKGFWLGWQDLNLRMRKSKSRALPLGDTPTLRAEIGVSKETRTLGLQGHNLAL